MVRRRAPPRRRRPGYAPVAGTDSAQCEWCFAPRGRGSGGGAEAAEGILHVVGVDGLGQIYGPVTRPWAVDHATSAARLASFICRLGVEVDIAHPLVQLRVADGQVGGEERG